MARVMHRLRHRLPHQRRRTDAAVEPRVTGHFDDDRDAAALLADQLCSGAVEFHFARSIGAVAELVLEPEDMDRVALPVRRPARQQEAAQAFRRLRQHQEGVAHRRRQEPFVAVQAEAAVAGRHRARRIGAQIGATLVLGQPHAEQGRGFFTHRDETLIVIARENLRQPFRRDRRRITQGRHRAVGHGERAINPALDLVEHVGAGRARHMGAWFRIGPRARMQASTQRDGHERVPGRMVVHFVKAMTETVERAQARRIFIGVEAELDGFRLAERGAERAQPVVRPARPLALDRRTQHGIAR